MKHVVKTAVIFLGALTLAQGIQAQGLQVNGDADAGESTAAPCAACHGSDGNSPAAMYPNLAGLGKKYLYKQLQDIQSGARPIAEMTGQLDNMSDQDLADMAAFYADQTMTLAGAEDTKVKLNTGMEIDSLKLGETLYRFGNMETGTPPCSGCHSPTGAGNSPAVYPRLGGQHADYIAKQLRDFRTGERDNDGEAQTMRAVAKLLSDAEIAALANYISGLN